MSALTARALDHRVLCESYRIMSQQLPTTLFTRLGAMFFRTLIGRAVRYGRADMLVATRSGVGRVDGFAVFTPTRTWITETVRRYPAAFAMASGAAMVKPRVWQRLVHRSAHRLSTTSLGQGEAWARETHDLPEFPEPSLYMIAVRPGREGQGIGRALLDEVDRSARRSGKARYSVYTEVSNQRANRFYLSNGLTHVGHSKPIDIDFNVYVRDL